MMKIDIEEVGPGRKPMHIEAGWDEVKDDYTDVVKEFAELGVPGFRPRKAPLGVVEQRYNQDIMETVKDRCARRLWREALDEKDLEAVGVAEIYDVEFVKGKGFSLKVKFDIVPEFKLPAYVGINLPDDADEGALGDEISRYLLQNTQFDLPASFIDGEIAGEDMADGDPGHEDLRKAAEARVKLMVILKRIARQDGIEVDEQDIDERVRAIAEVQGTTAKLLKNELATKGGITRLRGYYIVAFILRAMSATRSSMWE
jgi:FKBP-type peptidyl-prolyl cis-trans isomerase (trigger factor)